MFFGTMILTGYRYVCGLKGLIKSNLIEILASILSMFIMNFAIDGQSFRYKRSSNKLVIQSSRKVSTRVDLAEFMTSITYGGKSLHKQTTVSQTETTRLMLTAFAGIRVFSSKTNFQCVNGQK